jgi:hypothetical protein
MRVTKTEFVFPVSGGERAVPHEVSIPENAASLSWDKETLTLSYQLTQEPLEDGTPQAPLEASHTFTQVEIDAALTASPPPSVPEIVSKAQLKLALLGQGIDLSALVAGLPAEQQPVANILINDATHFERAATLVDSLGAIAGLSSEQVDALFIAAAQINPAAF